MRCAQGEAVVVAGVVAEHMRAEAVAAAPAGGGAAGVEGADVGAVAGAGVAAYMPVANYAELRC